jgi:hypothetical protein
MKIFKLFMLIVLSCYFSGCVSSVKRGNNDVVKANKEFQKKTNITMADVESRLGKPIWTTEKDGEFIYEYYFVKVGYHFLRMFPLISYYAPNHSYNVKYLFIYADREGNVKKSEIVSRSGTYPPSQEILKK